jgi:riboflavin kinase/FMN adenylyltransferase
MAAMTDVEFARRVLSDGLGIRHAAVGFDFTFGRGRSGSPEAFGPMARPWASPFRRPSASTTRTG